MIIYMISDNNGNLLLIGSPEIKIPERMFFMAKNGKVREAPTTTKSGALSMRGGIRSINIVPSGDKVDVVKLGDTLEEFRKRQSKKESNDLLNEMMNTKISKKIDMGEMPELKVKKVKKVNDIDLIDELKQLEKEYYNYYNTIEIKKTASGKRKVSMAGRESPSSIKSKYDTINKKIKNKQPKLLSADEYKKEIKKEEKMQKEEDKKKEEIEKVRQEEVRKNSPPTEEFGFINGKRLYKKKTVGAV